MVPSTGPDSVVSPGPKPRFTRDEIAAAAAVVPEVTIAAVARHLGTAPSSLYRYFDSREQMVMAAVEQVIAALPPPRLGRAEPRWRRVLEREVDLRWTMIAAHSALIDAWWDLGWVAPSSDDRRAAVVATLGAGGVPADVARAASEAVAGLIAGAAETLLAHAPPAEVRASRRLLDVQVSMLLDGLAVRLAR